MFTPEFEVEYFKVTEFEDSVSVEQPSVIFLRVFAIGNEDSLFYANIARTDITLRVDPDAPFTSFVIETLDSTSIQDSVQIFTDTLTVEYTRRQRLISEDCGPEQLYVDFQIQSTTYDSVNLFVDQLRISNDRCIEVFN